MPKRFLKPTIRQSKRWNTVSYFAQSLFIRLITIADDYGRYEADYRLLSNEAFPYGSPEGKNVEASQVESAFKELQDSGMINRYEANGNWYFEINNWQERVRSASRYPDNPASPNPKPVFDARKPQQALFHGRKSDWPEVKANGDEYAKIGALLAEAEKAGTATDELRTKSKARMDYLLARNADLMRLG